MQGLSGLSSGSMAAMSQYGNLLDDDVFNSVVGSIKNNPFFKRYGTDDSAKALQFVGLNPSDYGVGDSFGFSGSDPFAGLSSQFNQQVSGILSNVNNPQFNSFGALMSSIQQGVQGNPGGSGLMPNQGLLGQFGGVSGGYSSIERLMAALDTKDDQKAKRKAKEEQELQIVLILMINDGRDVGSTIDQQRFKHPSNGIFPSTR